MYRARSAHPPAPTFAPHPPVQEPERVLFEFRALVRRCWLFGILILESAFRRANSGGPVAATIAVKVDWRRVERARYTPGSDLVAQIHHRPMSKQHEAASPSFRT